MIELIKQYKELNENGYESKLAKKAIPVTIVTFVLSILSFLYYLSPAVSFVMAMFVFCLAFSFPVALGIIWVIYFDDKRVIQFKLRHKLYKGLLCDIFDLEDQETKDEFKLEKEMLERELFVKNGIPCIYILKMIDNIQLEKDNKKMEHEKLALYKNSQEEKEALIKAGTKIGAVFEEIKEATK